MVNDAVGWDHARQVAECVMPVAISVEILELPDPSAGHPSPNAVTSNYALPEREWCLIPGAWTSRFEVPSASAS
jgi:hypothetical protein